MATWIKSQIIVYNKPIKRWNYEVEEMVDWKWACSNCHYEPRIFDFRYNYCPYCGEKMTNPDTERMERFHTVDKNNFKRWEHD